MRLLVDGKDRDLPAGAPTVADVLRDVVDRLNDSRRWVLKLTLDGTDVTGADRAHFEAEAFDQHLLLEVESQDTADFLRSLLANMRAYLGRMRTEHEAICAQLRAGHYEEALRRAIPCLGAWRTFMQFLGDLVRAGAVLGDRLLLDADELRVRLAELQRTMSETRQAVEQQDMSLLGDLFAHDLPERLDAWEAYLAGLTP